MKLKSLNSRARHAAAERRKVTVCEGCCGNLADRVWIARGHRPDQFPPEVDVDKRVEHRGCGWRSRRQAGRRAIEGGALRWGARRNAMLWRQARQLCWPKGNVWPLVRQDRVDGWLMRKMQMSLPCECRGVRGRVLQNKSVMRGEETRRAAVGGE